MAEEPRPEAAPAPKKGGIMKLMVPIIIVVVAVVGALVLYQFFVKPRLAPATETPEETEPASGIPAEAVTVEFEECTTNTKQMPDEEGPPALFFYKVALECSNPIVAEKVEANKARFRDIIGRIHEFRTRDELDDPLLKKSIKAQVLQETNQVLKELLHEEAGPENRITDVFYDKWFIYDRL